MRCTLLLLTVLSGLLIPARRAGAQDSCPAWTGVFANDFLRQSGFSWPGESRVRTPEPR